jgi:hypothetical protein
VDVGVAYTFYNWYASYNGFATRKSKVLRNKRIGDLTQQTFVCEHLVVVLVYLNIVTLPECLVLKKMDQKCEGFNHSF